MTPQQIENKWLVYRTKVGSLENELERGNLNNSQFNKKLRKLNKRFGVSNDIG